MGTFGRNFVHCYSLRSVIKTYYFQLGIDLALYFTTLIVFAGKAGKSYPTEVAEAAHLQCTFVFTTTANQKQRKIHTNKSGLK